jgi:hypothetical protein
LLREAAFADSVSVVRSHFESWRGLPERCLPADSRLPGHCPAQEARWALVGKTFMSTPISAISTWAAMRPMPGIVSSSSRSLEKGASACSIRSERVAIVSSAR